MPASTSISIEVREADALDFPSDVLILKYAQAVYGVDAKVVAANDLPPSLLPGVGGYRVIHAPRGVAADAVLLVGVVQLRQFGYAEIRDFARRALCSVASECPEAQVIALTIHGAGYGLDETEAFDSELAGLLDAIHDQDVPPALERIVILEISPGRARRMASRLADVLEGGGDVVRGAPITDVVHEPSADRFRRVGYDSSQRGHAFVAMPFAKEFDDLFHYGISAPVRAAGLLCERIDEQVFTGEVLARMKRQIETSRLVVADLSTANPNVYLEVGYAWGASVPTVLMSRDASELKFDVQGQRCLVYSGIKEAEELLTRELRALLN